MTALTDTIDRMIAPLRRRLRLAVTRGIIRAVDDARGLQLLDLDLLGDESRKGIQRLGEYGLASRPTLDAEVVFIAVGGDRSRGVVIATDDRRTRPRDLDEGECCLWTPKGGKRVHCRADGQVDLGTAPEDHVALAKLVKAELDAIKSDLDAIKNWAGSHVHTVSVSGTPTAQTGSTTAVSTSLSLSWSPAEVAAEEVRAK